MAGAEQVGRPEVYRESKPLLLGPSTRRGNQLPYVDRLVYDLIENAEIINLRAIEGDIDVQARHMRISNYPLMVENADKGDYNVRLWREFGGTNVSTWFNQTYDGPEAELFNNEKFRQALSLGVDREQINEIVFLGTVIMRNYVPAAGHPHYPGGRRGVQVDRVRS